MHLPLENIAPCGKESSWLCSALQEYMALAWLKEQRTICKTTLKLSTFILQTTLKNDITLVVIGISYI